MSQRPADPAPTRSPHPAGDSGGGAALAEYDALADLFLGDEPARAAPQQAASPLRLVPAERPASDHARAQPAPSPSPAPRPTPSVIPAGFEAIVLGHLPVMASAWAMQYARTLAGQRRAPVAVLRVGGGRLSLELVGEPGERAFDTSDSLAAAVRTATGLTDAWLLRVDESAETQLPKIPGVTGLTLLTGADEAAVVGSYRVIKGLAENGLLPRTADEDASAVDHDAPSVTLRLAVMGAADDKARAAADRIRAASSTYLGCTVASVACSPRIAPASTSTLYRGQTDKSAADLVADVVQMWESIAREPLIAPRPIGNPVSSAQAAANDPAPVFARTGAAIPPALIADMGASPAPAPTRAVDIGAESHSRIGPRPAAADRVGGHAAMIAGIAPLPFRCPHAPRVEFACAADGTMHLLVSCDSAADPSDRHGPRAVEHLLAAAAWADANADLLRHVRPGLRCGPREVMLHVFTSSPKDVRGLLDTAVRVHASVPTAAGPVAIELN